MSKLYRVSAVSPISGHEISLLILADNKAGAYKLADLARKIIIPVMEKGVIDLDKKEIN